MILISVILMAIVVAIVLYLVRKSRLERASHSNRLTAVAATTDLYGKFPTSNPTDNADSYEQPDAQFGSNCPVPPVSVPGYDTVVGFQPSVRHHNYAVAAPQTTETRW